MSAGRYKIVRLSADRVVVANRRGDQFVLTPDQFASQSQAVVLSPSTLRTHEQIDFEEQGMLRAFGYHVGRDGLARSQRHGILEQLMAKPAQSLPRVGTPDYRTDFGDADTQQRLHKILNCLNGFAKNATLKATPPEQAIEDWREDARWLQHRYADLLYGPGITPQDVRKALEDLFGDSSSGEGP